MNVNYKIIISAFIIFLCIPNMTIADTILHYQSSDQLAIILALNTQKRYKDTLNIISEIPKPNTAILLEKARAQAALGFKQKSIISYKTILAQKPSWTAAQKELDDLLEKNIPQIPYKAYRRQSVKSILYQDTKDNIFTPIKQKPILYRKNWYMNINLYSYYDANINKAPNQGDIKIRGYRFNFDKPLKAYVIVPEIEAGSFYKLTSDLTWQTYSQINLKSVLWSSKPLHQKYDEVNLYLQTGPTYLLSPSQRISMQLYWLYGYKAYRYDKQYWGAQIAYQKYVDRWFFEIKNDLSTRSYEYKELNGWQNRSSFGINWQYQPKESFNANIEYIHKYADWDIHSYNAIGIQVGWNKIYKYDIEAIFSTSYQYRQYKGYSDLFASSRKDHDIAMKIDLSKNNWSIAGFQPHMQYSYYTSISNQKVFSQNAHQIMFYLSKKF